MPAASSVNTSPLLTQAAHETSGDRLVAQRFTSPSPGVTDDGHERAVRVECQRQYSSKGQRECTAILKSSVWCLPGASWCSW